MRIFCQCRLWGCMYAVFEALAPGVKYLPFGSQQSVSFRPLGQFLNPQLRSFLHSLFQSQCPSSNPQGSSVEQKSSSPTVDMPQQSVLESKPREDGQRFDRHFCLPWHWLSKSQSPSFSEHWLLHEQYPISPICTFPQLTAKNGPIHWWRKNESKWHVFCSWVNNVIVYKPKSVQIVICYLQSREQEQLIWECFWSVILRSVFSEIQVRTRTQVISEAVYLAENWLWSQKKLTFALFVLNRKKLSFSALISSFRVAWLGHWLLG